MLIKYERILIILKLFLLFLIKTCRLSYGNLDTAFKLELVNAQK